MVDIKQLYSEENDSQGGSSNSSNIGQKLVGDFIKKAVTMGASAVERAESTMNKTLSMTPTNISKDMIRDVLESFFENYTISVNAEIKFKKKPNEEGEKK